VKMRIIYEVLTGVMFSMIYMASINANTKYSTVPLAFYWVMAVARMIPVSK
jgi:hypothetical protein